MRASFLAALNPYTFQSYQGRQNVFEHPRHLFPGKECNPMSIYASLLSYSTLFSASTITIRFSVRLVIQLTATAKQKVSAAVIR